MTREDIKKNLLDGDGIRIARKCKGRGVITNAAYVNFVLRGGRKLPKRGKATIILQVAEEVALENISDNKASEQYK